MKRLKKIRVLIILFAVLLFFALGYVLYGILSRIIVSKYQLQMSTKLQETDKNLDKSLEAINLNDESINRLQKINAEFAAFYLKEDKTTGFSEASMIKLSNLLNVYNVILLDTKGNVTASAKSIPPDLSFTDEDFNSLLEVQYSGKESDIFYIDVENDKGDTKTLGLCGVLVDPDHILVVASDMADFDKMSDSVSSWKSILERNTIGQNGFTFAVSTDGDFLYFPYDPVKGKDYEFKENEAEEISETGLDYLDFKDGAFRYVDISGDYYYCGFKFRTVEKTWIICALPYEEIFQSVIIIFVPVMFAVFVILSTLILSCAMILKEYRQTGKKGARLFYYRKSRALAGFMVLALLVFSFFVNLLSTTSSQETTNRQDARSLTYSLNNTKDEQAKIKKKYSDFLLNISGVSARFLSDNPGLATRSSLSLLNDILQTRHMLLYDKTGTVYVSDSTYKGLTLSKDPEEPSYLFRQLLYGTPYVLQEVPDDDYLEKTYLYVGSLMTDKEGDPNGFVQLALDPDYLSKPMESASKEYILSTYSGTNSSHVFAVDMKNFEYVYHPRTSRIGKPVSDYGVPQRALRDNYVGYITVRGVTYFAVTAASNSDYVFIVTPADRIMTENFSKSFFTFLPCALAVLLLYLLLILVSGRSVSDEIPEEIREAETGEVGSEFRYDDAVKKFLKGAFLVVSGIVFVIAVFYNRLLPEDSIFTHIIGGTWESGVNLFSITWCVICICSVGFVTTCLNSLFFQLEDSLSSRGKTMTHMLNSLIKYAAIIGVIFSCAKRLGVQTDTLLASAGILTVVIGLGAQSLTSDVFDGLFIIIEGAFHVGDVITVDDCWRAKVLEIGIRNTRLLDLDTNSVKIVNNNSLKRVVNHSLGPEYIYLSIGMDYDEKIEEIEEIIKRELPEMRKNIPLAVNGPDYVGVDAFEDSAVMLRFCVSCRIEDYYKVKRGLNRELKRMFDRNGISVPFPQVVLSERDREES